MRITARLALAALCLSAATPAVHALSAEDIARAEKILTIVAKLNEKYPAAQGQLIAPAGQPNGQGSFVCPYKADGTLTTWADKAISAQVGAAVGEKAAEKASGAALSKIPGGGLLSGVAKKKGKEAGAIVALGGMDAIRTASDLSFSSLDDLAVYLHAKHAGSGNFSSALATAMTIYPDLEKAYQPAVRHAYEAADAAAKAKAAEAAPVAAK